MKFPTTNYRPTQNRHEAAVALPVLTTLSQS